MDWRTLRITQELKKHDRTLFAVKTNIGMVQVWRKAERWSAADLLYGDADVSTPTQFILALTDDWKLTGKPVERGIEPLMRRIQQMDSWSKESVLDDLRKNREREKEDKERQRRNENRARAYDLRKEFAAATNEINTSTLKKVDARRTKWQS